MNLTYSFALKLPENVTAVTELSEPFIVVSVVLFADAKQTNDSPSFIKATLTGICKTPPVVVKSKM
ncbi:hypothetical protein D3C86_1826580 [compost metagenome]